MPCHAVVICHVLLVYTSANIPAVLLWTGDWQHQTPFPEPALKLQHVQMLTKAGCFKQNVGCSAEQFAHDEQGCQQTSRHICCTWTGLLTE